jgi:putative hydrolase
MAITTHSRDLWWPLFSTVSGMTNLPFGFSPAGDDDPEGKPGQGPGPAGFDLNQLGSMLSQLGQMMSQAGTSGASTGPVNYDLARQLATSQVPASHPASSVDVSKVVDAIALAEVWLDGATAMPAGVRTSTAWTPRQWIDATMPTWEKLCSPIAEQVSRAWVDGLPEEAKAQAGPLLAMMGSMGGMAFGSQLGQGLAQLATEVLTSTDVGLPLGPVGTAALLPRSIAEFGSGLDLPEDQVRLYLATREAAHHRLYAGTPWLRDRVIALISEYAGAISVDFSAVEQLAASIDPSDPASIEAALGQGMFEPTITPGQQAAMAQLETLLALVEGWVDTVVAEAVGDRLPGASALRETLRRRRATGGPAEQTFATLIGLELRPRRLRAAADLWREIGASRGTDGRDALWAHPDLLPSGRDLDDPSGFVDRDKQFTELLAGLGELEAELPTDPAEASQAETPEASTGGTDDPEAGDPGPAPRSG